MSIGNNGNGNNDFRMSIDSWNCCRTSGTASGKYCRTYKIDFGFPELLSDYRNMVKDWTSCLSSRTVAGSSGELEDFQNSCSTYRTQGFCLKVLGITAVYLHHVSSRKTTAVHYQLELMGLPLVVWPVAKFIVPNWGGLSWLRRGIGLSYGPARLHRLAGRYNNPMPEPTTYPPFKDPEIGLWW